MLRYQVFIILFLLSQAITMGQTGPGYYFVRLVDKAGSGYSVSKPEEFLSARAIVRRQKQGIQITEQDLPVSKTYTDSLKNLGLEILLSSKWFNAVTVRCTDSMLMDTLIQLEFVSYIEKTRPLVTQKRLTRKWENPEFKLAHSNSNSASLIQLSLLHGDQLHEWGFTGKGLHIAVLDAGFYHVNQLPAFDSLRLSQRILGVRDFITGDGDVYADHTHGMNVLSILAGNGPGNLKGSAPDASYWLLRSEDASSEYVYEEDTWTAAAEFADSAGADIISSSLGYSTFNDSDQNHTYGDLDGRTSRVAQAALFAARRGMIVVNSAGNEGNKQWRYIISPADADSILAVGAVDSLGAKALFSSYGPTSDGRIKPDVMAMGVQVLLQGPSGELLRGNGTSFSAPIISGMAACLWQAIPEATAQEIILAIRQSGDRNQAPDNEFGYGIPNIMNALSSLNEVTNLPADSFLLVYPNPFQDHIVLYSPEQNIQNMNIKITSLTGKVLMEQNFGSFTGPHSLRIPGLGFLKPGLYLLVVEGNNYRRSLKIVKYAQ